MLANTRALDAMWTWQKHLLKVVVTSERKHYVHMLSVLWCGYTWEYQMISPNKFQWEYQKNFSAEENHPNKWLEVMLMTSWSHSPVFWQNIYHPVWFILCECVCVRLLMESLEQGHVVPRVALAIHADTALSNTASWTSHTNDLIHPLLLTPLHPVA